MLFHSEKQNIFYVGYDMHIFLTKYKILFMGVEKLKKIQGNDRPLLNNMRHKQMLHRIHISS